MKVNDDKTHLLVLTSRQKRKHIDLSDMSISTPTAIIQPSTVERLLGAQVHEDMRWKEHIIDSEESLVKALSKRHGDMKKVCKVNPEQGAPGQSPGRTSSVGTYY